MSIQLNNAYIGNYKNFSVNVEDTDYAVWYLDGHDFFSKELDLIKDTIPSIISDVRFDYEMNVNMDYPFNRFSIVEVPAHFSSYTRTWTRAQEKMQPEMVLVSEKMYNERRFDIKGSKKRNEDNRRRGGGGGRGRGQAMTD